MCLIPIPLPICLVPTLLLVCLIPILFIYLIPIPLPVCLIPIPLLVCLIPIPLPVCLVPTLLPVSLIPIPLLVYEQSTNPSFPLKIGLDVLQSHPLHAGRVSANTRPHQLRWGDQKMGTYDCLFPVATAGCWLVENYRFTWVSQRSLSPS